VIVEVLVAQDHGEDALANERLEGVLHEALVAAVGEAVASHAAQEVDGAVSFPEKEGACVGGDLAGKEIEFDAAATYGLKRELRGSTVRHDQAPAVINFFGWRY
jgi:hypothetical protein